MARAGSEMQPTVVRSVVGDRMPNLPARHPAKPAVAHIVNNLLTLSLGPGIAKSELIAVMRQPERRQRLIPEGSSQEDVTRLGKLLDVIYNDGKVFGSASLSSPIFWDPRFLAFDPSDDGLSLGLWTSFGSLGQQELQEAATEFVAGGISAESIAELSGRIVDLIGTKDEVVGTTGERGSEPARTDEGTPFGRAVASILASGLQRGASLSPCYRSEILRQFGVLAGGFAILTSLYDAIAVGSSAVGVESSDEEERKDPDDALGLVFYTGDPPGDLDDPLVEISIQSASDVMHRAHKGVSSYFARIVQGAWADSKDPNWDSFCANFVTSVTSGESAKLLQSRLTEVGVNGIEGIVERDLSFNHYRKLVKSLGGRTGMVVPRKSGYLRFVLETNMLTALVSYVGRPEMLVQDFVQSVNQRLGIVLGVSGLTPQTWERLDFLAGDVTDIENTLEDAELLLKRRMIQAGLALEFSDGTTVLRGSE